MALTQFSNSICEVAWKQHVSALQYYVQRTTTYNNARDNIYGFSLFIT